MVSARKSNPRYAIWHGKDTASKIGEVAKLVYALYGVLK